jgi:simple sugar transport system permease protein
MGIRIQKRTNPLTKSSALYVRLGFFFLGLIILGVILEIVGIDSISLYLTIIQTNVNLFPSTIARFITLLCIAVGLAIPFKARIDNIGAEGQYIIGTLAGFGTAIYFSYLPPIILIPLMFINGFILGALWSIPVVIFRAKGGFQGADVVVSFLLVFPAFYLMNFLITAGPAIWRDPGGFSYSRIIPDAAKIPTFDFKVPLPNITIPILNISLPEYWNFSVVHLTLFLALCITLIVYFLLFRTVNGIPKTKFGYEITVMGKNKLAGQISGISFFKVILLTMILSGGLAGIAGVGEIAGSQHRLTPRSSGYGFTAIVIAYLGGLNPIGIIFSSLFFAALIVGGTAIKIGNLPSSSVDLFSGTILIFVLISEFFLRYTIYWRNSND